MKKQLLKHTIAAAATLLVLAGCSNASSASNGQSAAGEEQVVELNWAVKGELPTADSALSYDTLSADAIAQFQEGLYRYGADGQLEPALAVGEPEVSEDGLTYTFTLREDAKWENGDPVTAHDFVFAWQRGVAPETAAGNAYLLYSVKNAQAINEGSLPVEELGIKALSDTELEVQLDNPVPYFLNLLVSAIYYPQNEAFVTAQGEDFGKNSDHILANGPFTLKNWDGTGLNWTYEKNEQYWDSENIEVDKINVQVIKEPTTGVNLFETGAADVAYLSGELTKQYQNHEAYQSFLSANSTYLEMGISSNPDLQNLNLRQALSLAIDREVLTQDVLADGSVPTTNQVPRDVAKHPVTGADFSEDVENTVVYDPELALEKWEAAKQELGKEEVKLDLLVSDDEGSKSQGEFIQGSIQQTLPGVTITLRPVPAKVRFDEMMSFDFDMALGGWSGSLGDAAEFLEIFTTTATHNHAQYANPEFDALIEASQSTLATDPEKRWDTLVEAANTLNHEQITLPLYQRSTPVLLSERIEGLQVNTVGPTFDFRNVTVTE